MPIPFASPFTQSATVTWPLPGVLALILLAMVVVATLGVRDLLTARRRHNVEGRDGEDRRR